MHAMQAEPKAVEWEMMRGGKEDWRGGGGREGGGDEEGKRGGGEEKEGPL